ncbi:hypothetical protein ACROYT_G016661 [Oculina patagonica]
MTAVDILHVPDSAPVKEHSQNQFIKMAKAAMDTSGSSSNDVPPELSVHVPSIRDIRAPLKDPDDTNLPVEFLLVTVKNCEFIACYMQLKDPFRTWFDGVGYVYFGDMCAGQEEKVRVALIRCNKGSTGPGSSLITVKNAVTKLRPKGVISVGTCSGLNPEKTKLGDIVVSAKLTTYASKIVTSTGEQSTGMRSYVSRHFLDLIKHAGDGWEAPLKNPETREVKIHCDGEFLSGPEQVSAGWRREELAKNYPLASAIEMEGEGIFTAAFDDQIEWLVVKGITDYADGTECISENWSPFGSVMAASVVANILSDPVVFRGWCHYKASTPFDLKHCQAQLRRHYNTMSQVKITPWNPNDTVHIDKVYTNLSWLKDNKTPRGLTEEKLEDYSMVFKGHIYFKRPKRILIYGRPGIGKTTFSQKLSVDWSNDEKEILKKFDLLLTIKLRDVCNIKDFGDVLKAASLLADDDVISADSLQKYVRENQEKVLIVLDGYDEYSAGESSDIHKIWKGSLLRDCCVLMTTRPTEDDQVRMSSDVQSRIRGFDSREQVEEFSSKFLSGREEVKSLTNYLSKEMIWDIAEIPLLLLMLCLIWREKNLKRLPKSRLELYERFVETILNHMVVKESGKSVERDILGLYKDELTKIGKLALEALLQGDVYVPRKHFDAQSNSLSEPMIKAGLFHISKLSSAVPDENIFFLHKSIQEFLAAWFIMHGGETDSVSSIDSLDKISKVEEILKFMCQWTVDGASAVFRLLRTIGENKGLTAYNFTKTPSIDDFSDYQRKFISISLDCLLCSPASYRQSLFLLFLKCVHDVLVLNEEQVRIAAREHLLKSTSSIPNYVYFYSKYSETAIDDDIFCIILDLNTAVAPCSGEIMTFKRYANVLVRGFFIKKEGQQMFFYLTSIKRAFGSALPTELLTELTSAPVSPFQKPFDDLSKNQDNSRALDLPENVPEQTRQHCLSFVREIEIHIPTSEELMVVNKVLPFITSTRNVDIVSYIVAYDTQLLESLVSNIQFTKNLHSLTFYNVDLSAKCATDIARSLHQAPSLRELNLSRNPLCSGVSDLAANLYHVSQLTKLELRNVGMGEKESEILATSLKDLKKLQVLDLSDNPMGHGIIELAKNLNSVPRLTQLWLHDTQIGEEEVSALARALKYVPELESLNLGFNPLGRGVSDLIQDLSSIPKLKYMYLRGCKMTKNEAKEFCAEELGSEHIHIYTDYHVSVLFLSTFAS